MTAALSMGDRTQADPVRRRRRSNMRTAAIRAHSAAALWARTPSRPGILTGPVPQHN